MRFLGLGLRLRASTVGVANVPNIWHIYHTKHKKHQISNELNLIIFITCEQYRCKFATVRNRCGISFNHFLFSFLSPPTSLYSFLFSLILPQTSRLSILFFFHSFFFSISLFFSLPLRHHPQFFLFTLFFFHSNLCRCGVFFYFFFIFFIFIVI